MSFQSVSEKLATLQEANIQLKSLITRLSSLTFQPGSVPLEDDEDNVIKELAGEIQQMLRDQEDEFGELEEDIYTLPGGDETVMERNELRVTVERALKMVETYEAEYREAFLSAMNKASVARKQEREILIQSYLSPPSDEASPITSTFKKKQHAELSKEEKEVNASNDVTFALRRTHDMMMAELSRSQFAQETLKESTASLAQLSESYNSLDSLLSNSRNLLGTLLRSQKSDTWYLETAFYILLTTIAWLVFRRLLYGPLWLLVWFPMKIFIRSWMNLFSAMGLLAGSSVTVAVSNVSASQAMGRESVSHSLGTRNPQATMSGARAPSINVGGGGRGAPMRSSVPEPGNSGESLSEQVGKIIEDADTQNQEAEEKTEDAGEGEGDDKKRENQRNPMKRMWEEDVKDGVSEGQRKKKDEL